LEQQIDPGHGVAVPARIAPARSRLTRVGAGSGIAQALVVFAPVEIERKFLLQGRPEEFEGAPSERIDQGYVAISDDGVEVRVRRAGERTVLTVKQGAGLRRLEEELDIPAATFEALWPITEDRRLEKERFRLERDGRTIELDVYGGDLHGLVVAEVEFASERESVEYRPPAWLGREVTGDERYANRRLAVHGMPDEEGD
jgi:adenylate cyclase